MFLCGPTEKTMFYRPKSTDELEAHKIDFEHPDQWPKDLVALRKGLLSTDGLQIGSGTPIYTVSVWLLDHKRVMCEQLEDGDYVVKRPDGTFRRVEGRLFEYFYTNALNP